MQLCIAIEAEPRPERIYTARKRSQMQDGAVSDWTWLETCGVDFSRGVKVSEAQTNDHLP